MKSGIKRRLDGFVLLSISGDGLERFFNMCSYRGIFPSNITYENGSCLCEISIDDFRKIRPMVRKTGIRVRLLKKCGLPFFIYRYRKRWAIPLGLILGLIFLYVMSLHIWSMDFEGNSYYSDETLMEFIESIGIKNSSLKKNIICDDIESKLRIEFDKITWVSVEIDGTLLKVNVKENLNTQTLPQKETRTADLVADCDGTVLSIITRSGTPKVKAGDEVKAGDILVSGVIELHDDNGTIVDYNLTYADADVYIQTKYEINERIEQYYEVETIVYENKGFFVSLFGNEQTFLLPASADYPARKETDIHQLKLFDNLYLPIYVGSVDIEYYETQILFYDDEEFLTHCGKILNDELQKLAKKGVEIIENNVIIQSDKLCAYLTGSLIVSVKAECHADVVLPEIEIDKTQE